MAVTMLHPIPEKPLAEMRQLAQAAQVAQQRLNDFGRAVILTLGLDPDDRKLKVDLQRGVLELPEPEPELPAAPLPSNDVAPVPVAEAEGSAASAG